MTPRRPVGVEASHGTLGSGGLRPTAAPDIILTGAPVPIQAGSEAVAHPVEGTRDWLSSAVPDEWPSPHFFGSACDSRRPHFGMAEPNA